MWLYFMGIPCSNYVSIVQFNQHVRIIMFSSMFNQHVIILSSFRKLKPHPQNVSFPSPVELFFENYDVTKRKLYLSKHTPLYENEQNGGKRVQWRLLWLMGIKINEQKILPATYNTFQPFSKACVDLNTRQVKYSELLFITQTQSNYQTKSLVLGQLNVLTFKL